ncbi:MAG: PKD domain-containing protein [Dehalococcoidia bacterium]
MQMSWTKNKKAHSKRHLKLPVILIALILAILPVIGCNKEATPVIEPTPPPPPPNEAPVIHYMSSEQQITPLGESMIRCVATDPDKDTLSFSWSASGGTITGEGEEITWTAPETTGDYIITATVTDGEGAETSQSVTISVTPAPNHAPVVTLIVTVHGKDPVTVTPATEPISMKKTATAEIECIAEDPDGDTLEYKWSATEGRINGEGPIVTYFASESGDHAITVTVIDSQGGQTKVSAYVHVPCCGAG